jgi:microfibrillar-associated protein 1
MQEAADDARGTTGREEIFDRDFSAPTGEDHVNKELLPKVMQVCLCGWK